VWSELRAFTFRKIDQDPLKKASNKKLNRTYVFDKTVVHICKVTIDKFQSQLTGNSKAFIWQNIITFYYCTRTTTNWKAFSSNECLRFLCFQPFLHRNHYSNPILPKEPHLKLEYSKCNTAMYSAQRISIRDPLIMVNDPSGRPRLKTTAPEVNSFGTTIHNECDGMRAEVAISRPHPHHGVRTKASPIKNIKIQ